MAIRYEQKKIDEVVAFVAEFNKENGRGGQSAAVKKFGINPITIASWLKKAGVKTPGKKKGKKGGTTTKPKSGKKASASVKSVTDVLKRMQDIQSEIDSLRSEFDALKGKI